MPSPSYKELHVTIRHPTDNTLLGCGWLLTNKVIITCAHVLWSESRRLYYDSVDIVVTFKDNVRFSAHVHDKITNEPRRRDLAILTPTHIAFEPETSEKYGILAPIPGLRCASLGVPGEWDGIGNWAEYIVGEELPNSWTQLIGSTNRGFEIRAGFSGAPVWDDQRLSVIGIVVGNDTNLSTRTAFMIGADKIFEWIHLDSWIQLPIFDEWAVLRAQSATDDATKKVLADFLLQSLSSELDQLQRRWIYEALRVLDVPGLTTELERILSTEEGEFARRSFR